jgi:preprotein translocase subunit SecF
MLLRGLNFGIEFRCGVEFNAQVANPSANIEKVTDACRRDRNRGRREPGRGVVGEPTPSGSRPRR